MSEKIKEISPIKINFRKDGVDVYPNLNYDGLTLDKFDEAFEKIEMDIVNHLISESERSMSRE